MLKCLSFLLLPFVIGSMEQWFYWDYPQVALTSFLLPYIIIFSNRCILYKHCLVTVSSLDKAYVLVLCAQSESLWNTGLNFELWFFFSKIWHSFAPFLLYLYFVLLCLVRLVLLPLLTQYYKDNFTLVTVRSYISMILTHFIPLVSLSLLNYVPFVP